MKTKYEEIVDVTKIGKNHTSDLNAILKLARQERLPASAEDSIRRLFLGIDLQHDFIEGEGAALPVTNSIGDVERITHFIYNNMSGISRIMCSLDTHNVHQIFHPDWWVNPAGEHPEPYTIITYEDIVHDRWTPVTNYADSIRYVKELEKAGEGKKKLCIWPCHCIKGTVGNALENEFYKMLYFHSVARKCSNSTITKGEDPLSEMYGIIKPEFDQQNFINTPVVEAINKYDEIYIAGEAASHCVMESVRQIVEYYKRDPAVTKKIIVLKDCTSPISGYEAYTEQVFEEFKNLYGIQFVNSTDIQF